MQVGLKKMPQWILYLDAERRSHWYRLSFAFDGAKKLEKYASQPDSAANKPFLAVLDPALIYARQARFIPTGRGELMAALPGFFPFQDEELILASFRVHPDDGAHIYAIPQEELQALYPGMLSADMLIVAKGEDTDILAAIDDRLQNGGISDLKLAPAMFFNPALLMSVACGFLLVCVLMVSVFAVNWQQTQKYDAAFDRFRTLQTDAQPLIEKRQQTAHMIELLRNYESFANHRGSAVVAELGAMLRNLDDNDYIEHLEFDGKRVHITGFSNDANRWLSQSQFDFEPAVIFDLPVIDRFESSAPVPASISPGTAP